jgi:hypothetical protein
MDWLMESAAIAHGRNDRIAAMMIAAASATGGQMLRLRCPFILSKNLRAAFRVVYFRGRD